ncbi:hypothetical protein PAF15_06600 [Weissella koreensis]|uniref:hypothetical protein n=1 Tax=Weissella koreensis TaxID=165096 RepID=UPI0022BA158C|nr:hypothetical protein [Weissella koreensis]MCZ9311608.1 hypothetical protein [Weissella koreensis]
MMRTVESYNKIDITNLSIQGTDETIKQHININGHNIKITPTRPNYGGLRWWFICPSCHKRKRTLYLSDNDYYCRKCLGINYKSQTYRNSYDALTDEYIQILNDIYKLKWQIDPEAMQGFLNVYEPNLPAYATLYFIPDKPYTMRQTTYDKRIDKLVGMIEQLGQVNRLAMGMIEKHKEDVQEQYQEAYNYQQKDN